MYFEFKKRKLFLSSSRLLHQETVVAYTTRRKRVSLYNIFVVELKYWEDTQLFLGFDEPAISEMCVLSFPQPVIKVSRIKNNIIAIWAIEKKHHMLACSIKFGEMRLAR